MPRHQPPAMYQHYKGNYYLLVRVATHHETGEEWAVYRPVDGADDTALYVRPLAEFDDAIAVPDQDSEGNMTDVPRFREVSAEEGEQVAINRLKEQVRQAREAAGDDPHDQMVVNLVESTIEKMQQRLREASEQ